MLSRPWRHTARTNAVHPPPETRSPTPSAFVRSSFRGFGINSPVSRPSSCSLLISPIEALAAPASQCDGVLHISATYNFRHQRRYGVADSMPLLRTTAAREILVHPDGEHASPAHRVHDRDATGLAGSFWIPEATFAAKKLAKPANEQQVWMGKHKDGELPNAQ
jgi:hypothetical protein